MLKIHLQPGNAHFLPSDEVFKGFFIYTPLSKKATKVSYLPLRLKDFLILLYYIWVYYSVFNRIVNILLF